MGIVSCENEIHARRFPYELRAILAINPVSMAIIGKPAATSARQSPPDTLALSNRDSDRHRTLQRRLARYRDHQRGIIALDHNG
jgi:hypothetical protein